MGISLKLLDDKSLDQFANISRLYTQYKAPRHSNSFFRSDNRLPRQMLQVLARSGQ